MLVLAWIPRSETPAQNTLPSSRHLHLDMLRVPVGFPGGASDKEPACQCRRHKRSRFKPLGWEDPLEEDMANHSSVLA